MAEEYPTYHLTEDSLENLDELAELFVEKGLTQFHREFSRIDDFVELAQSDPPNRDDHKMRVTPRPKYLLELLNFAVYDRLNR